MSGRPMPKPHGLPFRCDSGGSRRLPAKEDPGQQAAADTEKVHPEPTQARSNRSA